MDRDPLALCVRVTKTGYVDHITVVESNKHSEDARGGMHRLLEQTKLNDSLLKIKPHLLTNFLQLQC